MPSPPDVKQPAIFFSLFQVRRVPVPPFALPSLPQCLNRRGTGLREHASAPQVRYDTEILPERQDNRSDGR